VGHGYAGLSRGAERRRAEKGESSLFTAVVISKRSGGKEGGEMLVTTRMSD